MLGIGLFFVGITLIINGWGSLLHIDYRSLALINLFYRFVIFYYQSSVYASRRLL